MRPSVSTTTSFTAIRSTHSLSTLPENTSIRPSHYSVREVQRNVTGTVIQPTAENTVNQITSPSSNIVARMSATDIAPVPFPPDTVPQNFSNGQRHQFPATRGLHSTYRPTRVPTEVERVSIFQAPRNSQNLRVQNSSGRVRNSDESCERYQAIPTYQNVSTVTES